MILTRNIYIFLFMGKKTERGPGRPEVPENQKLKARFLVLLTDAEYDLIKRAVPGKLTTWARETLLRAAKRLL
jgi:hypothetical protein